MTTDVSFSGPIVCGIDFSEHSRRALAHAAALGARLGGGIIAVTAIDPLLAEAATARSGSTNFLGEARYELETILRDSAPQIERARAYAFVGNPADVLHDVGVREGASMLVIGTQGLGRAHRVVFGSTTLRVMRSADRPVLAVPPSTASSVELRGARSLWFGRIVCGIDFGAASILAARASVELGRRLSTPVALLHAAGRLAVPQAWAPLASSAADRHLHQADARLREIALGLGENAPSFSVLPGDAADVLEADATSGDPALVVLGLGGAAGQRPGSTAIQILAHTRTPVLAIPAPD